MLSVCLPDPQHLSSIPLLLGSPLDGVTSITQTHLGNSWTIPALLLSTTLHGEARYRAVHHSVRGDGVVRHSTVFGETDCTIELSTGPMLSNYIEKLSRRATS